CHGDNARAIGPLDDGRRLAAASVDRNLTPAHQEPVRLVVANEGGAAFLDDDAVGFADDQLVAFTHLAPLAAELLDPPQGLALRPGRLRRNRSARGDGGLRRRSYRHLQGRCGALRLGGGRLRLPLRRRGRRKQLTRLLNRLALRGGRLRLVRLTLRGG